MSIKKSNITKMNKSNADANSLKKEIKPAKQKKVKALKEPKVKKVKPPKTAKVKKVKPPKPTKVKKIKPPRRMQQPKKVKVANHYKRTKAPKPPKKISPPRFSWLSINFQKIRLPRINFYWTKRHTRILVVSLSALAVLVAVFIAVASNYTVDTIIVEGSTHYSNEEIYDMVLGDGILSHNSIYLSMKYRNKELKDIPFIETLSVHIMSPTAIKITIYEKAMAGFVEYMGQYIYFDNDGTVIETSESPTKGIPQIVGMKFDHFVLYEPLPVDDKEIFGEILDVSHLLEKYDIDVDKIYFDDDYNLTLYFGDARVKLGGYDNIDEKIIRLKAILPELKDKKGVLRMENYNADTQITTFEYDK